MQVTTYLQTVNIHSSQAQPANSQRPHSSQAQPANGQRPHSSQAQQNSTFSYFCSLSICGKNSALEHLQVVTDKKDAFEGWKPCMLYGGYW